MGATVKSNLLTRPARIVSLLVIVVSIIITVHRNGCHGQQQIAARSSIGSGTTLVVSQDPNGNGISVMDRATGNRQVLNTNSNNNNNNLEVNDNEQSAQNGAQEDLVVAGLLEWLKKKKREKEEKKNKEKQPIILPVPIQPQPQPHIIPQRHERKEIHIHINNHIKKDSHKKKHHHGGHKKHHGGYEDYHAGDYHDHDKYYMGKFHAPLLSHHFSFDHFDVGHYDDDHHYGGGGHHDGGHDHSGGGGDYHAGYESRPVAQFAASGSANGGDKQKASAKKTRQTKR